MVKVLSQQSSFPRSRPLPCPACPVQCTVYSDGFMEFYIYNVDHSIQHFFYKLNFKKKLQLFELTKKLARVLLE